MSAGPNSESVRLGAGPEVAHAPPHVRDTRTVRGIMGSVLVALAPCLAFAVYNTGYQANRALAAAGAAPAEDWRARLFAALGVARDPSSIPSSVLVGATYVLPLLAIALCVGALWQSVFAIVRKRRAAPGLGVTAAIFTACLPATLAWWQAAFGISVAIVVGREIFGGTGRNVFNPAAVGLAFLYFAYPADMRGVEIWIAVDGVSAPTLLRALSTGGAPGLEAAGTSFTSAFLGRIPGALAETSTLACLIGAVWLVLRDVASWRIIVGVFVGAAATAAGMAPDAVSWHLVLGGLAFGAVFLATDPVTAASTDLGRWIYGLLIGAIAVLIRVANPVHVEGVVLAILIGNMCAPLIDYGVIRMHVRKRRRRLAAP